MSRRFRRRPGGSDVIPQVLRPGITPWYYAQVVLHRRPPLLRLPVEPAGCVHRLHVAPQLRRHLPGHDRHYHQLAQRDPAWSGGPGGRRRIHRPPLTTCSSPLENSLARAGAADPRHHDRHVHPEAGAGRLFPVVLTSERERARAHTCARECASPRSPSTTRQFHSILASRCTLAPNSLHVEHALGTRIAGARACSRWTHSTH